MNNLNTAQTSKEFLQLWYEQAKEQNRNLSFEAIALRAGYSSRSFVRQVLLGQKPITPKSLPRFIKAMNLTKTQERLLKLLLEKEFADFNIESRSEAAINADLAKVREALQLKRTKKISVSAKHGIKSAVLIYPHLSQTEGQSLESISSKCSYSAKECRDLLDGLLQQGFVRQSGDLYFATERLLHVQEQSKSELLNSHMQVGIGMLKEHIAAGSSATNEHLYFRANYSVDAERVLEFKNRLRTLLTEFAESTESDQGVKTVNLVCGFF